MSLTASLSAIRGDQPGAVFWQFKDECTVMINYVQNLLQKGTDVMSSLQDNDTQVTSLKINYAGIEKLRSLLNKIQKINNFALDLGSDDETENEIENDFISHAVNPTIVGSSRAIVNPTFEEYSMVSCNVQVGDILDMVYVSGNNPYEFWLRYYSTKTLDEVIQILTTRCKEEQLRPCHKPYTGLHVCVYDGQQCYRAKIINMSYKQEEVQISVLNIDNGKRYKVKNASIYHLDSDVSSIPVQGLCCRLQGSLGDSSLWNDVVASLFSQILTKSNLVVTVTAKLPGEPPQFVVDVDCHNEERKISKLELSKWITATVFPKLCEVKQKSLPLNRETLNILFTCLDPAFAVEQVTSNECHLPPEEDFAINARVLNSNLQQLSISNDNEVNNERSHSIDTRSTMGLELASKSKLENSRFVLDWNLPQNSALPTPISPNIEKSLLSQSQTTVSTAWKEQHIFSASVTPFSDNPLLSPIQIANSPTQKVTPSLNMYTLQRDDTCKMNLSLSDSKTLSVSPNTSINHEITNSELGVSSSFIIGNGISKKPEQEKSDFILLQPVLIFTVGQTYDVMLAYIENPAEFYVHIVCEENIKIDDLHLGMNDYYNSLNVSFKSKSEAKKYVGTYCAAYYASDEQWCRGLIMDWNESSDDLDISVKFVDYGNVSPVPLAAIQPLRQKFTALPICAQRCHLANIHPIKSMKENILTTWSLESTNLFKCLVDVNAVYSIVLTESSNGSSASLPVLLENSHNSDCSMINKSMVELGYAVHLSPIDVPPKEKTVIKSNDVQTKTEVSENTMQEDTNLIQADLLQNSGEMHIFANWDPMAEDFFSEVNTMYHDDEDASYVVTGYKPKDEKRVCKLFAAKGYCNKRENCLKEHTFLNPDGWTTDQEAIFVRAFRELLLPVAGSNIILNVTLIVKSNAFWAIIHDDLEGMMERGQRETANEKVQAETLATLTAYMNQDCNVKKLQRLTVAPALGQILVACYMDGLYYRARVIDSEEDKVLVMFVDYGNEAWLKMSDVRDIEQRYLYLPFQAVECVIANVEALPGDKDIKGRQFFLDMIKDIQNVHARVVLSCNDEFRMEVLVSDDKGYDLGNRLIQAGFCTERCQRIPVSQRNITVLPA